MRRREEQENARVEVREKRGFARSKNTYPRRGRGMWKDRAKEPVGSAVGWGVVTCGAGLGNRHGFGVMRLTRAARSLKGRMPARW
jgi:hypothetical protein